MDLDADARELVLRDLPASAADRPHLEAMTTGDLLIEYLTWRQRVVNARPRTVHESRALQRHLRRGPKVHRTQVRTVLDEIARGDDLTPRLSRLIQYGFRSARSGKPRRDQDLLLNDWGVHHLHLGDRGPTGTFSERGGDVLYVAFTPTDAYAIGVFTHNDWVNDAVLKIMAEDWPDRGIILGASPGIRLAENIRQEDRGALRAAGVTVLFEHRQRVFMPRWGLTTGLTATGATMTSNAIVHATRALEDQLTTDPDLLWLRIPAKSRPPYASDCDWHLYIDDRTFGVEDSESQCRVQLASVR